MTFRMPSGLANGVAGHSASIARRKISRNSVANRNAVSRSALLCVLRLTFSPVPMLLVPSQWRAGDQCQPCLPMGWSVVPWVRPCAVCLAPLRFFLLTCQMSPHASDRAQGGSFSTATQSHRYYTATAALALGLLTGLRAPPCRAAFASTRFKT